VGVVVWGREGLWRGAQCMRGGGSWRRGGSSVSGLKSGEMWRFYGFWSGGGGQGVDLCGWSGLEVTGGGFPRRGGAWRAAELLHELAGAMRAGSGGGCVRCAEERMWVCTRTSEEAG
jgi:hypothetical protein